MAQTTTAKTTRRRFRSRLSFDLDVDICVVGAGLAGLTVAREAARLGASVAVLEGRHVGWNASGHQLGTVMPGYSLAIGDLIERIGLEDARELWSLSKQGAEYVRATATEELIPGIALTDGALEVSNVDAGETLISRLQTLGEDFETEVEGWQVDRVRSELRTGRLFSRHLLSQGVPDRRPQVCSRPCGAGEAGRRPHLRGHAGRQHRFLRYPQAHRDTVGPPACLRTSCSPATSISVRRSRGCRRRCFRFGVMPRSASRSASGSRKRSPSVARSATAMGSIISGSSMAIGCCGQPGNHLGRAAAALRSGCCAPDRDGVSAARQGRHL